MNTLDLLIIEVSLPAACFLLYALFLDVQDSLMRHGLLPILNEQKVRQAVYINRTASAYRNSGKGSSAHRTTTHAA
jgi:hypothetical protein